MAALDADRARLTAQRDRLDHLTPTPELIAALMADFDKVLASGTTPQKKHLLHRVVKEVRVHDRTTVEAFYAVPNLDAVRTQPRMAPQVGLEPTTLRLTAGCSAIELLRNNLGAPRRAGAL